MRPVDISKRASCILFRFHCFPLMYWVVKYWKWLLDGECRSRDGMPHRLSQIPDISHQCHGISHRPSDRVPGFCIMMARVRHSRHFFHPALLNNARVLTFFPYLMYKNQLYAQFCVYVSRDSRLESPGDIPCSYLNRIRICPSTCVGKLTNYHLSCARFFRCRKDIKYFTRLTCLLHGFGILLHK